MPRLNNIDFFVRELTHAPLHWGSELELRAGRLPMPRALPKKMLVAS